MYVCVRVSACLPEGMSVCRWSLSSLSFLVLVLTALSDCVPKKIVIIVKG